LHITKLFSQKNRTFADDLNEMKMKKIILCKSLTLAVLAAIFMFVACKQIPTGEIFEVKNNEGITINYMVTDGSAKHVEVVGKFIAEYRNTYAGTIVVPQTVEYEGTEFTVVAVGKNAFAYSENLRAVHLPSTVVELKPNSFRECPRLNKVKLPDNLKVIGEWSFNGCTAIDSLCIPQSIKVIRNAAFSDAGCKYISVPEKIDTIEFGAFSKFSVPKPLIINDELFAFPRSFTSTYHIPANIVAIQDHAFEGCYLSKVVIDETVKEIGAYAFSRCYNLDSVVIPKSIEQIPDNCFEGCHDLRTCIIGNNIKGIGFGAFDDCEKLKMIHIPSSVSKIGRYAFRGCWHLEHVSMENGIREIDDKAFEGCEDLSTISFPSSLRKLGDEVFSKCQNLRSVELPETMEFIGKRAFAGCKSLINVRLPKSMKDIGAEAFEGCEKLKEAILPSGLDSLGTRMFDGCKSLYKLVLPQGIKELCMASIRHCESLEFIEIPSSVTKIGAQTFGSGGKTVLTIKMESPNTPQCHEDAFMFRKVKLLIPKGSKDNYIWAKGWMKTGTPNEY